MGLSWFSGKLALAMAASNLSFLACNLALVEVRSRGARHARDRAIISPTLTL